ncbi:MAG: Gfo/Idh/MocA family oxidoreductase [Calditrichia bacterium]
MSNTGKKKIRYGIIGFGRYAERRLLPAFGKSQYSELAAIQKRNPVDVREKAAAYHIPASCTNPKDLAADPSVEAVIITSPPGLHREHTILAAEAGKHVMAEKPPARNAAEVSEMIEVCRQNGVKFMSAFVMRFIDAVQEIRDLVQRGELGELHYASGYFGLDASLSTRSWLDDPELSGGGPVADIGSHILDLLQFITGQKILKLKSILKPSFASREIERNAVVSVEFENNILGNIYLSFNVVRESGLTFYGSEGKLDIRNFNQPESIVDIELVKAGGSKRISVYNENYYARLLDNFSEAILFEKPILSGGDDALQIQRLIDRIYEEQN